MNHSLPSIQDFPIVGIGASAGGLSALQEFFSCATPDMAMSYVVVMHLSPTHASDAAALLQKWAPVPVVEVTGPTRVEQNKVYVIPPDRQLELIDGYLRVRERAGASGWPVAVDTFFRTLAAAHASRAFGVVL